MTKNSSVKKDVEIPFRLWLILPRLTDPHSPSYGPINVFCSENGLVQPGSTVSLITCFCAYDLLVLLVLGLPFWKALLPPKEIPADSHQPIFIETGPNF